AGLALGYILLPLVLISWLAFFRNAVVSFPPDGYTFRWFRAILDQRNFVDGFLMSLQVGVFAMVAGLAIGVPASLPGPRHRVACAPRVCAPRVPRPGSHQHAPPSPAGGARDRGRHRHVCLPGRGGDPDDPAARSVAPGPRPRPRPDHDPVDCPARHREPGRAG